MIRKLLMACCVAALPLVAQAQTIAGGVYEDAPGLALRQNFTAAAGVTVLLYGAGGASLARTATDAAGQYRFRVSGPGEYWVAVDSRSMPGAAGTWAEQSFGPAGALCAQPEGAPRANFFAGVCAGGKTIDGADDASTLSTAEHVARVPVRNDVNGIDFAFSFNLVTTGSDGKTQGSLRQFIDNANAIPGGNRMRFVPIWRAPVQRETSYGAPPRWWAINLATPLAELTDDDTTIDGTAYSFVSPDSPLNPNPGRFRERPTIRQGERPGRQERPELELVTAGERGIVCSGRCGVRALAIHGSPVSIVVQNDARLEHVVVGLRPDEAAVAERGSVGIQIEGGTTIARDLYVTDQSRGGIAVATAEGRLEGERLDVS
ncbi:MAG: large repetitive protein, partial [Acidobacteriota bacterium]|nr:large repetitive protein [Acidobacteriota bacterium]